MPIVAMIIEMVVKQLQNFAMQKAFGGDGVNVECVKGKIDPIELGDCVVKDQLRDKGAGELTTTYLGRIVRGCTEGGPVQKALAESHANYAIWKHFKNYFFTRCEQYFWLLCAANPTAPDSQPLWLAAKEAAQSEANVGIGRTEFLPDPTELPHDVAVKYPNLKGSSTPERNMRAPSKPAVADINGNATWQVLARARLGKWTPSELPTLNANAAYEIKEGGTAPTYPGLIWNATQKQYQPDPKGTPQIATVIFNGREMTQADADALTKRDAQWDKEKAARDAAANPQPQDTRKGMTAGAGTLIGALVLVGATYLAIKFAPKMGGK